jgi:putative ABC transport system permease protein
MIKYYFKLAIRKFQFNRLIFIGSIITVSIGALCISLLFSYVYNELTMNGFHKHVKDIYMMVVQISPESQYEPFEASRFVKFNYKDYPEVESLVSLLKHSEDQIRVSSGEAFFSSEVLIADSTFFTMFDFKLLIGNKKTILSDPGTAIITEDYARKIFGDKDPVGQEIKLTTSEIKTFTIKGVIEKLPSNSSITFDIVLPSHSGSYGGGADFLLVNKKFNKEEFEKKIENLGNHVLPGSKLSLMSFDDIYFYKNYNDLFHLAFTRFGDKKNVYVLCVIMLIVFAITALNFSGFQVIQINASIKDIGLGKVMGIKKRELFMQKTIEIMLLIFFSSLVVTIAYVAVLPYFNSFTKVFLSPSVLEIIVLNITIIISLFALAMIYPAIITLKIPIIDSLKGKVFSGSFLVSQKSIVTIQYTLTIASIIASLVIFRQVSLMLHKDLGFNCENIIRVKMLNKELPFMRNGNEWKKREAEKQKSYQYILNELASIPAITAFAQGESPINPPVIMSWKLKGGEKDFLSQSIWVVHPDFLQLLGLKISEGRFFDAQKDEGRFFGPKKDKSKANRIVINEAAKKFWGIKDIQESRMLSGMGGDSTGYEIIGVVKDFNYQHLSGKPQPLFMVYFEDINSDFLIKFKDGSLQSGLQSVSRLFKEVNPGEDFSYSSLSDEIAAMYQKEKRLSQICFIFTIIALFITAIGIFVIAVYDVQRRTKEIGIRKVYGSRVCEIMFILNKDFVKLVLIAFIIACPIAWYPTHKWLENFAYKTELSWWIFAAAGAVAVAIALLTVSVQSYKAATRNPVEALRYE